MKPNLSLIISKISKFVLFTAQRTPGNTDAKFIEQIKEARINEAGDGKIQFFR
jgi:hypothetical protein